MKKLAEESEKARDYEDIDDFSPTKICKTPVGKYIKLDLQSWLNILW